MRLPVLLVGLLLLLALGILRLADPPALSALRFAYFDALQRIAPRAPSELPVRVVDIDEASLAAHGQWPWPRDRLAELTGRLAEAGAAAIAFDILFAEADRLSPLRIAETPVLGDLLREGLAAGTLQALDTDRAFARAIAAAPVVLGTARTGDPEDAPATAMADIVPVGAGALSALPDLGPATRLLPVLAEAARGIGAISVGPGANATVIRTMPLVWASGDGAIPGLSLEALRVALGEEGLVLWGTESGEAAVERITLGPFEIPTTTDGQLWLHARPESPDDYVPAHRVLSGDPRPDLDGAIVLVGSSAAGLLDLRTTALGEIVPGVAIHAQAIEQILTGRHLVRSDFARGLELLLFASAGLVVAAAMALSGPLPAVLVGGGAIAATGAASWAGFAEAGLLIDATFPLLATFLTFSLLALYRLLVTDRDARRIRRSFSHYVAPAVLKQIESGGRALALGGADQDVTVLFSDIRNFTALGQRLEAQEVVALLNRLFEALSDEIVAERGTIDKFMGDSVMAFWNAPVPAPDHALRAARAALAMRRALARLNAGSPGPAIRMGTGLATGPACVGNIGARKRFNYTAIGATVNAAAHLEGACRQVDFDIIASRAVREAAPGLAWLPAGAIRVKGVRARLDAHLLVGDEALAADPEFRALAAAHEALGRDIGSGSGTLRSLSEVQERAAAIPVLGGFYARLPGRLGDFRHDPHRIPKKERA